MNSNHSARTAFGFGAILFAAIGSVFFTTPAYAGCKICYGVYPNRGCIPAAPGAGGYWSCVVVGGNCILGQVCEPTLSTEFDIDGRMIGSREDVAWSLLHGPSYDETPLSLHDYLAQSLDGGIVRNCKGLAIAQLGSWRAAEPASDLVL